MERATLIGSPGKRNLVRRVLVTGISGTGKSTLVRYHVRNCNRLIIHDVLGEWGDCCVVAETWSEVYEAIQQRRFRIAVQVEDDAWETSEHIARLARSEEVGDCVIVFEELSLAFTNRTVGPMMQRLVRLGRRENCSAIFVTQRAFDCPIDLRSQMTNVIAFHSIEPRDVEYIGRIVGRKEAEKILALRGHQYYAWDLTLNVAGPVAPKVMGNDVADSDQEGYNNEARTVDCSDRSGDDLDRQPDGRAVFDGLTEEEE